jgi:hypothetical protein
MPRTVENRVETVSFNFCDNFNMFHVALRESDFENICLDIFI